MANPPCLRVEDRSDGVRVFSLDNPAKANALDDAQLSALGEVLREQTSARAFLFRSAHPSTFCSGYDLRACPSGEKVGPLPDDLLSEILGLLRRHPIPSVALVEGPAYGAGCELAASCDVRVGGPAARFCMPPAKLGIVYAPAGIARLAELVGVGRARWMLLTGRVVDAPTALGWGLLDVLSGQGAAEAEAFKLAGELACCAPLAVSGMKDVLCSLGEPDFAADEHARLRRMRQTAFESRDAREGKVAFFERRPPRFEGR